MPDKYRSFEQLRKDEIEGVDYAVVSERRDSSVAIVAPHGGAIEPETSQIAEAIAGERYNYYAFEGLKAGRPHEDFHITSHKFNEPKCLSLIANCDVVVTVHGRADKDDNKCIWIGGRNIPLREAVLASLTERQFSATIKTGCLAGLDEMNICNRGGTKQGVQLELPRTLRRRLHNRPLEFAAFVAAVVKAIEADR